MTILSKNDERIMKKFKQKNLNDDIFQNAGREYTDVTTFFWANCYYDKFRLSDYRYKYYGVGDGRENIFKIINPKIKYATKKQLMTIIKNIAQLSEKGVLPSCEALIRSLGYVQCHTLFSYYFYSYGVIYWGMVNAVNSGLFLNFSKNMFKKWIKVFKKTQIKIQKRLIEQVLFSKLLSYLKSKKHVRDKDFCMTPLHLRKVGKKICQTDFIEDKLIASNSMREILWGNNYFPTVKSDPPSLAYLAFHSVPESQYPLFEGMVLPVLDRWIDRFLSPHLYI
jgi:hypothetical protein